MTAPAFDPEAVIDAMAPLLGLAVAPEHRAGIAANLRALAAMAALVLDPPVGDHAEPAPVFTPVIPHG
ncbi:AtzG-like protein [Lichenibacterium dinghuense]|uniref:AtzG-like protein n=1 Tax=Lichenibacterium dinghuense TaxID=2895977 RepID=UPI001F3B5F6E|nr:AtzG-like protein [Lichenibacterium sp. 6Y81]